MLVDEDLMEVGDKDVDGVDWRVEVALDGS